MGFEAVVSKARFRRIFQQSQVELHNHVVALPQRCGQEAQYCAKCVIAVRTAIIREDIYLVAGDFNGASWRRKTGVEQQYHSTQGAWRPETPGSLCLPAHTVVGPWWCVE